MLITALTALFAFGKAEEECGDDLVPKNKDIIQTTVCQAVRAQIAPFGQEGVTDETVAKYCVAYGLKIDDADMQIFMVESEDTLRRTACYVITPENPKACVVFVHGYLDHAAAWRLLVPRLLKENYMLFMYDLPGHGFSDGARADIGNFSEYLKQLGEIIDFVSKKGLKMHVVAHSTGAGVMADLLLHDKEHADKLSNVVLLAPLLHSAHWGMSRFAVGLAPIKSVKRSFRKNSSDPSFLEFQKSDPLQYDRIPMSWTNANAAWAKSMLASDAVFEGERVLFIQGDNDDVVDWKYNLKYYRQKFPKAKISMYDYGRHQLMNESKFILDHLSYEIIKWLDK